jgi:NTP pyrophosphatase (non-canonical NTP hydrolase)
MCAANATGQSTGKTGFADIAGTLLVGRRYKGMPYLPLTELLAGVAEEAAELAQAALKLRRIYDGTNPTPKPIEEAIDAFEEEIADLQIYLDRITYSRKHVADVKKIKEERWKTRLSNNNKTEQKFAPNCTNEHDRI